MTWTYVLLVLWQRQIYALCKIRKNDGDSKKNGKYLCDVYVQLQQVCLIRQRSPGTNVSHLQMDGCFCALVYSIKHRWEIGEADGSLARLLQESIGVQESPSSTHTTSNRLVVDEHRLSLDDGRQAPFPASPQYFEFGYITCIRRPWMQCNEDNEDDI